MALIDGALQEVEQKGQPTNGVIERVPDNRLVRRPRKHSRTFGDLEGSFQHLDALLDELKTALRSEPLLRFCLDCLTSEERRFLEEDLAMSAHIQAALQPSDGLRFAGSRRLLRTLLTARKERSSASALSLRRCRCRIGGSPFVIRSGESA